MSIPKPGIPQPLELSAFWFLSLRFFSSISRKTTATLQQGQGTALPGEGAPAGGDIWSRVWGPRQTSALGSTCTELTTQQPRTNAEKDGTLCGEITLLASRAPNSATLPARTAPRGSDRMGMSWAPVLGMQTQPLTSRAAVVGRLSEPPLGGARESPQPPGSTSRTEVCLRDAPVSRAPSRTRRTSTVRTVTEMPKITTCPEAWALQTLGPMAPCSRAMLRSWGSAAVGPLPTMHQWHPHSPFWRPKPRLGITDAPRGQNPRTRGTQGSQRSWTGGHGPTAGPRGQELLGDGRTSARSLLWRSVPLEPIQSNAGRPEPAPEPQCHLSSRPLPSVRPAPPGSNPDPNSTRFHSSLQKHHSVQNPATPHTLPVPGSQPGHDQQGQEWASRWTSSSPWVTGQDRALVPASPSTGRGLSPRAHLLPCERGPGPDWT